MIDGFTIVVVGWLLGCNSIIGAIDGFVDGLTDGAKLGCIVGGKVWL